jgi:Cu/Ag efflux protein CusF
MRAFTTAAAVAAISITAGTALAQVSKTITGETVTTMATIESIETSSRQVTLKNEDGTYEVLTVPASVKRFDSLKVGDKVKAHYYENIVLRLKAPGEKDVDTATGAVTPGTGAGPAGTLATQRTITATITSIDRNVPSITFKGPNGWTYSSRVEDKATLAKVKEGDKVDITWTTAALVSIDDAKE